MVFGDRQRRGGLDEGHILRVVDRVGHVERDVEAVASVERQVPFLLGLEVAGEALGVRGGEAGGEELCAEARTAAGRVDADRVDQEPTDHGGDDHQVEAPSLAEGAGEPFVPPEGLRERVVLPALWQWRAHRYPTVIEALRTALGVYDRLRAARGVLSFQDLLCKAAALLAANADEPLEQNFIRRHALAYQQEHGCTMEIAALRVFGNAEGAYGANVTHLIDCSRWDDEDELAETYTCRKGFAYGTSGRPVAQPDLLKSVLAKVDLAYQNLDSVELGVTTVDNYFDTLGGITQAVKRAKGGTPPPVYIGDQTRGKGQVRTLSEQVALETRTRALNPKWYEGMLRHGHEGVRHIECHLTNTMGWSATTGQVQPWVYQQLAATFILDPAMRERMATLNPAASAKFANRLLEAFRRQFWQPDAQTLQSLRDAGAELEDRLEGIQEGMPA